MKTMQLPNILRFVTLAVLFVAPCPAARADSEVYKDDFEKMDVAWGDPSDTVFVKEGKMILRPAIGYASRPQYQGTVVTDGTISVKVKITDAEADTWDAGLLFWGNDTQNYYIASVTPEGGFMVSRLMNNRWLHPVSYRKNDAIKKGKNQENDLRLVLSGKNATLFINGKEVIRLTGQPPESGSLFGLYAESGSKKATVAEFTHLLVTKP
jgi:hypothetical protein